VNGDVWAHLFVVQHAKGHEYPNTDIWPLKGSRCMPFYKEQRVMSNRCVDAFATMV
jgi:hypothetical protein